MTETDQQLTDPEPPVRQAWHIVNFALIGLYLLVLGLVIAAIVEWSASSAAFHPAYQGDEPDPMRGYVLLGVGTATFLTAALIGAAGLLVPAMRWRRRG